MSRAEINPTWIKNRQEEMRKNEFISVTVTYNPAAQWLIAYLDQKNVPCKVVNLGAGVKKITLAERVCPHCGGKGYLK